MILFSYSPVMVPVATPQGSITALVFASDRLQPKCVGELPLNETAAIIARGTGIRGDSRTHVAKLADELDVLEIEDPYVEQLLQRMNNVGTSSA